MTKIIKQYDLLSETPPVLNSRLPGFVKHAISCVPDIAKCAAANAMFPPAEALMHDVFFRYWDNSWYEPSGMEATVGPSGVGKGYIDPMIECIIRSLSEHDKESERKLAEYSRVCNTRGDNKDKPERPDDAAILVPEPDMTNAALVQLLMDAEREGNRSIYTMMPEIDMLDECCASHKKVTRVIRLNFDSKRYGQQRATPKGITGKPTLRWKMNVSCVEQKARDFFKGHLLDGTVGRFGFSLIPKPEKRQTPVQGKYDEKYQQKLDPYLIRLVNARGRFYIPQLNRLTLQLKADMEELTDLAADDEVLESLWHRSLRIAWTKGCVLFLAEDQRWTKEIENFVIWSLYYDLWSKIHIFAPQMHKARSQEQVDVRKFGPSNMLNELPQDFSQQQVEQLRLSKDMPIYSTKQLRNWVDRGYITYSAQTGLYSKTEEYLRKHPQSTD